jgi:drug/metabolite transporter (DMT)-like permease
MQATVVPGMELHRSSGRRWLGFALASTTMLLWAILPLALKILLRAMDSPTVVWYRFFLSSILLGVLLAWRGGLPPIRSFDRTHWLLLGIATVGLALNYLAYMVGLDLTSPANAQVLIQLAPLLLALGGLLVFGERFSRLQWAGFCILILGLVTFFGGQLRALASSLDRYFLGTATLVGAAVTWAIYGLAQKQLLHWFSSQAVMLCIYAGCTLCLALLAEPVAILELDGLELGVLLFCALNTLVAYGAFAAALAHWEASRVSSVLALTPLATLAFMSLLAVLWPGLVAAEAISATSLIGAAVVVAGSLLTSLGGDG